MTPGAFYDIAYSSIGRDASPRDRALDYVGCMETVDELYRKAYGRYIGGGINPTLSTAAGYQILKTSPRFKQVLTPVKGCIVISPTGSPGSTGAGHIGIVGNNWIMSNDSRSGTWEANYTKEGWVRLFAKRGFPTYYFLPLSAKC